MWILLVTSMDCLYLEGLNGEKKKELLPNWIVFPCFPFPSPLSNVFLSSLSPFSIGNENHLCRDSLPVRILAWNLGTFALNSCSILQWVTLNWLTSKVPRSLKSAFINGLGSQIVKSCYLKMPTYTWCFWCPGYFRKHLTQVIPNLDRQTSV